jgi:hypothetical protein
LCNDQVEHYKGGKRQPKIKKGMIWLAYNVTQKGGTKNESPAQ